MTREQFLQYALSPTGVGAIVGVITSLVLPWFYSRATGHDWDEAVDKKTKSDLFLVFAFLVPLFATICLGLVTGNDIWTALGIGFAVAFPDYVGANGTHKVVKAMSSE